MLDADRVLKDAREAVAHIRRCETREEGGAIASYDAPAIDLADAFEALDGWLSKGGYLPQPWSEAGKVGTDVGARHWKCPKGCGTHLVLAGDLGEPFGGNEFCHQRNSVGAICGANLVEFTP